MSEVSQPITVIAKIATTLPLFVTMMYFVACLLLHTTQFESNSVKLQTGPHLSVWHTRGLFMKVKFDGYVL